MSYINKKGKTTAWRQMVIRQQVSDVIAYGEIITTLTKAKETRKHVDRIITLSKKNTLASRRQAAAILLDTKNLSRSRRQAVLGRQRAMTTPWLTERHGYDPT